MGTRGAFGVIIGEQEKIGYNQYDSYPEGKGLENLAWLRRSNLAHYRDLAEKAKVVDDSVPPTGEDVKALHGFTNLNVSEQSTQDWYCLTKESHGNIGDMLECGYIMDSSEFPLDSLFCEWAYLVDFDRNMFEVYVGFQKELPKRGRWAGRPNAEDERRKFEEHVAWCKANERVPWMDPVSEYKAVELIANWSLDELPSDEHFLSVTDVYADEEATASQS